MSPLMLPALDNFSVVGFYTFFPNSEELEQVPPKHLFRKVQLKPDL